MTMHHEKNPTKEMNFLQSQGRSPYEDKYALRYDFYEI